MHTGNSFVLHFNDYHGVQTHCIITLQQIEHGVVIAFVYTHTQTNTIYPKPQKLLTYIPSLEPLKVQRLTCPCQRPLLCPAGNRPPGEAPIPSYHRPSATLSRKGFLRNNFQRTIKNQYYVV